MRRRSFTKSAAFADRSIPTHWRPSISAATHAVAQPQKGSSTTWPLSGLALMMRSNSAKGFWVG